ncbi:MAG TPA: hypothetical protein VKB09_17645 [Thermomicrobiales bacterium]|nr:hypothetical protein [Thermomicrobiales bacterium]
MLRRHASLPALAGRGPALRAVGARLLAVLILLASITSPGVADAAPAARGNFVVARNDIPPWLSAETASRLDLGFDVLVPFDVPSPFDGEPAVDAYDGYYSLYWLIAGAPPTYLLITGEVGGSIPDFSYYDRNVQLEVNADVQGTPAYHDLTPIYDKVYWQVGDVVYTIDSHNLSSTDSLSIANRLFPLGGTPPPADTGGQTTANTGGNGSGTTNDTGSKDPAPTETPAAPATLDVPETVQSGEVVGVNVSGAENATLSADGGTFTASDIATLGGVGEGSYDWRAPETESDQTITFTLADGESGKTLATAQIAVQGVVPTSVPVRASLNCPVLATAGHAVPLTVSGSGIVTVDASDGAFPAEPPNTEFAPDADGSDALTGTLPAEGEVSLSWLAPGIAMTAYFFVYDPDGNTIAECGTEVTYDEVQPEGTPTPTAVKSGEPGDGTQLRDHLEAIVAQVLSYQKPASGDATGAPKATQEASDGETESAPTPTTEPPTPTAGVPTPTVEPTATLAPSTGTDGMVAQTIGPEGGDLHCPSGTGASLVVPPKALKEPSTVTIRPVADRKLPGSPTVELIAGTAFDVTIATANGESVEKLGAPATLTITLPEGTAQQSLTLYRVTGTRFEPLSNVQIDGTKVSAPLNRFSRIVAGIPTPSAPASSTRDPLPFILAALGFVVALMAFFAFGSALLRGRARTVTPRRTVMRRGARIR